MADRWEQARADYEAGVGPRELARRYGGNAGGYSKRASKEGWTKPGGVEPTAPERTEPPTKVGKGKPVSRPPQRARETGTTAAKAPPPSPQPPPRHRAQTAASGAGQGHPGDPGGAGYRSRGGRPRLSTGLENFRGEAASAPPESPLESPADSQLADDSGPVSGRKRVFSLVEAAAILGKHRNTLSGWIDDGCPVVRRADRARGVEWQIDIGAVVDWLLDRASEDAGAGGDSVGMKTDEANRRRAIALMIAEEVSTAELLSQVVNRRDAAADIADFCIGLRTGLSTFCAKLAGRAASMTSPTEIQALAEAEMNRVFDAAAEELGKRWTHDDGGNGSGDSSGP